jgi:hypothetical protein
MTDSLSSVAAFINSSQMVCALVHQMNLHYMIPLPLTRRMLVLGLKDELYLISRILFAVWFAVI